MSSPPGPGRFDRDSSASGLISTSDADPTSAGESELNDRSTVHWLGGWASSLDCWEPQLTALFPDFNHRFMDTHLILESTPAQAGLTDLPVGDVMAAWSLGSLRVHRWIETGAWPKNLPLLSLCPVFRFVQPGAFGESILLRMEQKLGAEREVVLRDFWRRMPKAVDMPLEWEENWIAGTRRYDDAQILQALQFLRMETVDVGALQSLPTARIPCAWDLIAGARDRLAPVGEWKEALPTLAQVHVYEGGHIPFWECPELIQKSLYRLSHDHQ